MRLQRFITETEELSGKAPEDDREEKSTEDGKETEFKDDVLTPEQELEATMTTAIGAVVKAVKTATDNNGLNSAVKKAAPLYKEHGEKFLTDLKKAMSVDIKPEMVDRFIEIAKNFSDKLTHLK